MWEKEKGKHRQEYVLLREGGGGRNHITLDSLHFEGRKEKEPKRAKSKALFRLGEKGERRKAISPTRLPKKKKPCAKKERSSHAF